MTAWLNGAWREEACVSAADRGFLLGDGLFETIYVEAGAATFLDEHLARLHAGLAELQIAAALPKNMDEVIGDLAHLNGLAHDAASVRLTVTRGPGPRGLVFPPEATPTVLVTMAKAAPRAAEAASLIVSRYRRAETSIAARCKAIGYLDNILARNEAAATGADEALMLNSAGRIAGASSANLFAIMADGSVVTPPISEGALPGVVRGVLLSGGGAVIKEAPLAPDTPPGTALFLTNSLIGLRPARLGVDETTGNAPANEIFNRLEAWYQDRLKNNLRERMGGR